MTTTKEEEDEDATDGGRKYKSADGRTDGRTDEHLPGYGVVQVDGVVQEMHLMGLPIILLKAGRLRVPSSRRLRYSIMAIHSLLRATLSLNFRIDCLGNFCEMSEYSDICSARDHCPLLARYLMKGRKTAPSKLD